MLRYPRAIGARGIRRISRSHSTSTYHPKVHAYPFTSPPENAIDAMSWWAAITAGNVDKISALLFSKLNPFSKRELFQPDRIEAVYYPSWVFDAEAAIRTTVPGVPDAQNHLTVQVYHTYVPGNNLAPISSMSFNTDVLRRMALPKTLPWDSSLESQHGMSIKCLPYKLTPFPMADKISELKLHVSYNDVESHTISFEESTVDFMAAYPVLIPLYLAQYHDADGVPFTMIHEGHSLDFYHTRSTSEVVQSLMQLKVVEAVPQTVASFLQRTLDDLAKEIDEHSTNPNNGVYDLMASPRVPVQDIEVDGTVEVSGMAPGPEIDIPSRFQREYVNFLQQWQAPWLQSLGETIDMDSLRVRPYSDLPSVQERMRLSFLANRRSDVKGRVTSKDKNK
ncbi:hypothetical protein OF83DRAFT_1080194 [Amylostereum chailletii]|nr:hypothetical protein OF83DRAFT_1080194 [Amylostereum chailletii]